MEEEKVARFEKMDPREIESSISWALSSADEDCREAIEESLLSEKDKN